MTADDVRRIALGLADSEEKETWGHPTFRVRDKIFATLSKDGSSFGVKSTKLEQAALVGERPDIFSVPAYTGKHGWVAARLDKVDPDEARELIVEAWRLTAPKRLVAQFDAAHPPPSAA